MERDAAAGSGRCVPFRPDLPVMQASCLVAYVTSARVRRVRHRGYRASVVDTPVAAEPAGAAGSRQRIADAARELFAAHGYEHTTVDAIAERAGVARRTFFRYFRSKDDAILPDHERVIAAIETHLAATDDLPPVRALCSGARVVFRSYVDDPVVSLQRYQLTRSVPALRARENAIVNEYFRLFRRFLTTRFAVEPGPQSGEPDASLRADVIAGAVVAAHNKVLRDWLKNDCDGDPMPGFESALGWVVRTFETTPGTPAQQAAHAAQATQGAQPAPSAAGTIPPVGDDVVVAVFRTDESLDDVVQRISRR
jgi:AcrR family transcriptional regulator